jgi:hypothetical protein
MTPSPTSNRNVLTTKHQDTKEYLGTEDTMPLNAGPLKRLFAFCLSDP